MGRMLLIVALLFSSIEITKQKMLNKFKVPYKQLIYASLALFMLSGCGTTGTALRGAGNGLRAAAKNNQRHANKNCVATQAGSYAWGNTYDVSCY